MDYKIYLYDEYENDHEEAPLMAVAQALNPWEARKKAGDTIDWGMTELSAIPCTAEENGAKIACEASVPYIR